MLAAGRTGGSGICLKLSNRLVGEAAGSFRSTEKHSAVAVVAVVSVSHQRLREFMPDTATAEATGTDAHLVFSHCVTYTTKLISHQQQK